MKKTLREQLNTAARKYAEGNGTGDFIAQLIDAYILGASTCLRLAGKQLKDYEKDITEAVRDRFGKVEPWLRLQIVKTARLWHTRDRIAEELDMEQKLQVLGTGSTRQVTVNFDQRAVELRKYDEALTKDFTALGLNLNSSSSAGKDDDKGEKARDGLRRLLDAARNNMNEVPDMQ